MASIRDKGSISYSNNFEVAYNKPLDSRMLVPEYAALTNIDSWKDSGSCYLYKGMIVACQDKPGKLYQFIGGNADGTVPDEQITDKKNWKEISGTGDYAIPVYDQQGLDSLGDDLPEKYITIANKETDLDGSTQSREIQKTGTYVDILFSALRSLQHEVWKLKNSFQYGIESYTEKDTASSVVLSEDIEDTEALWAIDPDDLSELEDVSIQINSGTQLAPYSHIVTTQEGVLDCQDEVSADVSATRDVEEAKLCSYVTIDPQEKGYGCKFQLSDGNGHTLVIDYAALFPQQKMNVLTVLSRQVSSENDKKTGSQYIWISATDASHNVIVQGYYSDGVLQENMASVQYDYFIDTVTFNKVKLYRCSFHSKAQAFSNDQEDLLPTQPVTDDYKFRAAHLTIRSVKDKEVLQSVKDRILNNELVWVEEESKLYIKSNYKIFAIGSSDGNNDEDTMTTEELKQWLLDNKYITDSGQLNGENIADLKLADLESITFIHEGSGKSFQVSVDAQGQLVSKEISDSNLVDKGIQAAESTNSSNQTTYTLAMKERGAVAKYTMQKIGTDTDGTQYTSNKNTVVSKINSDTGTIEVAGDRVRISEWYAPVEGQSTFNCSHDFIEITNCGTVDYPLDNIYLGVVTEKTEDGTVKAYITPFRLSGMVKAGSSYLIRGKQRLDLSSPLAYVKVSTYDYELWSNKELLSLQGVTGFILYHKAFSDFIKSKYTDSTSVNYDGNCTFNPDSQYEITDTIKEDFGMNVANSSDNTSAYFPKLIMPDLVDIVLIKTPGHSTVKNWSTGIYTNKENTLGKDQYKLDPAKQAYKSLTSASETSAYRLNKVNAEYIPLDIPQIEFPHSSQTKDVSAYTPKASYESSTVCTDKTQLDTEHPNMLTCSFGINGLTTRCFNWISVGNQDEYVWIRKQGEIVWNKFESYKEITEKGTESTGYPRRKEFSPVVTNAVYARMTGTFPATGTPYVGHKVIVQIVESAVGSPTTYEYCAGRALKSGGLNTEHCSETYTFTLYPDTYKPRVYQVTDQQGFGWMEYQVWAAAANKVAELIKEECTETSKQYPVIVNTGDMTQNGTRINEWLDYYNSCICLNDKYEQMYVVGNNDLGSSVSPELLGTGDDDGKSSPYFFHLFYCYEVEDTPEDFSDTDNVFAHPLIVRKPVEGDYENVYVPSLYYFHLGAYGYLMVNSELTTITCKTYYGYADTNLYTGFHFTSSNTELYYNYSLKDTIEKMINSLSGKTLIACCHEMPFTVMNDADLKVTSNVTIDRSISSGKLIGSHLNRINASTSYDKDKYNYWFSKLLQDKGIKLCIGGHKHTYCITYPVKDMDKVPEVFSDNRHISKAACVKRNDGTDSLWSKDSSTYFSWYTDDSITDGVVYLMCQATGYKLASNKELPSPAQGFSKFVPKTANGKADVSQTYPMFSVISYETDKFDIDLYRISGIKVESTLTTSGKVKITEFSEVAYSTKDMKLEKLLGWYGSGDNQYTNKWYVENPAASMMLDTDRCYDSNGEKYSAGIALQNGGWNNETHTETVSF